MCALGGRAAFTEIRKQEIKEITENGYLFLSWESNTTKQQYIGEQTK